MANSKTTSGLTFFNILSDILLKESGKLNEELEFNRVMNRYMVIRYLSMKDSLVGYAEYINKYLNTLNNEQFYKLCYNLIPKQNNGYIKYISKPKTKSN